MLHLTYDSSSVNKSRGPVAPSELSPRVIYRLNEIYAGEDLSEQPPLRRVSGALINRMIHTGEIKALRTYKVQESEEGVPRILNHLPAKVEKVLH